MNGDEVSQREIDFLRGYAACASDFSKRPEKAIESLEGAARAAWALTQAERLSEAEGETPYA